MEIKKILVPVDGSDASKRAFKMAVDVAKVYGAELVVIKGVGHLTHYETPDQVAAAIQRFIG